MPNRAILLNRVLPGYEYYVNQEDERQFEEEDYFRLKMNYARILISLWSHACLADGVFHNQEANIVGKMIAAFFQRGSIFESYIEIKDDILQELLQTFDSPLPIKSIKSFAEGNPVMATNFYEDAVCIVYADGALANGEREFLDDLAQELELSRMDKKRIEARYIPS